MSCLLAILAAFILCPISFILGFKVRRRHWADEEGGQL